MRGRETIMANPYAEELERQSKKIGDKNPFNDEIVVEKNTDKELVKKFHYEERHKSNNYFNLILDSDFKDIELEILGLRYVSYVDPKTGKKVVELERKEGHYLNESGAEYLLTKLRMHTSSDLKLGFLTEENFKRTMTIFTRTFIRFMKENLQDLGMDTEKLQRKGVLLTIAIVNRVYSVYSRSIMGSENKRSHGDITLSGNLEGEKEAKFDMDSSTN